MYINRRQEAHTCTYIRTYACESRPVRRTSLTAVLKAPHSSQHRQDCYSPDCGWGLSTSGSTEGMTSPLRRATTNFIAMQNSSSERELSSSMSDSFLQA